MAPFIFAPIVRVHPAALTVKVHEVPRAVRVRSQGGWVRNEVNRNTHKGSGGNEKLPPHRIPMVGIV